MHDKIKRCKRVRSKVVAVTCFYVANHTSVHVVTPTYCAWGKVGAGNPSLNRVLVSDACVFAHPGSAFRIVSTVNSVHYRPMLVQMAATS
jgi:hypothetical protein